MENPNPAVETTPDAEWDGTPPLCTEEKLARVTRMLIEAYMARGRIYHACGELALALADLDHAVRLDPENAEAYTARARVRLEKGDHHLALEDAETAFRLGPGNCEAIYVRGLVYQALDQPPGEDFDWIHVQAVPWLPEYALDRTSFESAYVVQARFRPYSPTPDRHIQSYPMTEDGLQEALPDADRLSYSPEDRLRLAESGEVPDPAFDPIVVEVRSLYKIIQSYASKDENGDMLGAARDDKGKPEQATPEGR